jgi:hypothetical protein
MGIRKFGRLFYVTKEALFPMCAYLLCHLGNCAKCTLRSSTRWQFGSRTSPSSWHGNASRKLGYSPIAFRDPSGKLGHASGPFCDAWFRTHCARVELDESSHSCHEHSAFHREPEHFKHSGHQPQRFSVRDFA